MRVREPAVAGQFYPLDGQDLRAELGRCFSQAGKPGKCKNSGRILAVVCPHAGYMYSGPTAAFAYKALAEDRRPETAVIIGPNHSGAGPGISVFPAGAWRTPLGDAPVDGKLAAKIGFADEEAHVSEHSAEVQVPFLQFLFDDIKIVPVCMLDQGPEAAAALGSALAKALDPKKHVVIASTDFSHYVPYERAFADDMRAIAAVKKLDGGALYGAVEEYGISMCGYGPVAATLAYAGAAGAKKAELLKYSTSGDVGGDRRAVVGYAALTVL